MEVAIFTASVAMCFPYGIMLGSCRSNSQVYGYSFSFLTAKSAPYRINQGDENNDGNRNGITYQC